MERFSKNQLERYPLYLKYFKELEEEGIEIVSSPKIADKFGYSQEQVRKDLQAVSDSPGKPKCGRSVHQLIMDLESFLGYSKAVSAAIIGVGHLGGALMNYPSFAQMGLEISCGFDVDPSKVGTKISGKPIYSLDELGPRLQEYGVMIAIICVPVEVAQQMVDLAIENGVGGIWNFAPTTIKVKDGVALETVNLASSLAVLSHKIGRERAKVRLIRRSE